MHGHGPGEAAVAVRPHGVGSMALRRGLAAVPRSTGQPGVAMHDARSRPLRGRVMEREREREEPVQQSSSASSKPPPPSPASSVQSTPPMVFFFNFVVGIENYRRSHRY